MLNDEQLDDLTTRLLKKIAPMLGLEYEEPEPQPVTTIEDENGLVHVDRDQHRVFQEKVLFKED